MTYGVPYSFVPGTKAKANEVNANFNDIIEKINNSESRIDSSNSQIETLNSKCQTMESNITNNKTNTDKAITDLTNQVNTKANNADIDGFWTKKTATITTNTIVKNKSNFTFDLSKILPKDNNKYEIILNAIVDVTSGSSQYFTCNIGTDIISSELMRIHVFSASIIVFLPVGTNRKLYISCDTASSTPRNLWLYFKGYRKVR